MSVTAQFVRYNANPRNATTINDCFPRAISKALNIDYKQVRKELREIIGNSGETYTNSCIQEEYLDKYNLHLKSIFDIYSDGDITIRDFIETYIPYGTYIIYCFRPGRPFGNGHVVCCIDGTIYDTWNSLDMYVESYCKVL